MFCIDINYNMHSGKSQKTQLNPVELLQLCLHLEENKQYLRYLIEIH